MTSASSPRRRLLSAATLLCCLALSAPTFGQASGTPPTEDASHTRTAARTLAAQGAEAFEKRDFAAALDLFQRAGALVEAPTIVLMQARTLVELGRWVEAADRYSFLLSLKSSDDANPAFQAAVQAAADEYESLKTRLPLLKIKLQGTRPAEVWVDGRQLPAPLVGVDNPLDPGEHRVEVRETGHVPIVREVTLAEGAREELVLVPHDDPAPEALRVDEEPRSTVPIAAVPPPARNDDTLAWVALGVGAGATLVGVGTGLYALNKKSDLDAACNPGCPPSFEGDIDSFRQYRTISYVAFGAGALSLGWGGYLLLSGEPQSPTVAVRATTRGAWVEGSF